MILFRRNFLAGSVNFSGRSGWPSGEPRISKTSANRVPPGENPS
jgi:hypothetical protein